MTYNPDFAAPCGLYCGVCAIRIAHQDKNEKLKGLLVSLYQGSSEGKGALPNSENMTVDDIHCGGCLSDDLFLHCQHCEIRSCVQAKGYEGCHQCDDFPCGYIDNFPMTVGKKVILRATPYRREHGTEKWIVDEEARYHCPECGNKVFRGLPRCNKCKAELDLD